MGKPNRFGDFCKLLMRCFKGVTLMVGALVILTFLAGHFMQFIGSRLQRLAGIHPGQTVYVMNIDGVEKAGKDKRKKT